MLRTGVPPSMEGMTSHLWNAEDIPPSQRSEGRLSFCSYAVKVFSSIAFLAFSAACFFFVFFFVFSLMFPSDLPFLSSEEPRGIADFLLFMLHCFNDGIVECL